MTRCCKVICQIAQVQWEIKISIHWTFPHTFGSQSHLVSRFPEAGFTAGEMMGWFTFPWSTDSTAQSLSFAIYYSIQCCKTEIKYLKNLLPSGPLPLKLWLVRSQRPSCPERNSLYTARRKAPRCILFVIQQETETIGALNNFSQNWLGWK